MKSLRTHSAWLITLISSIASKQNKTMLFLSLIFFEHIKTLQAKFTIQYFQTIFNLTPVQVLKIQGCSVDKISQKMQVMTKIEFSLNVLLSCQRNLNIVSWIIRFKSRSVFKVCKYTFKLSQSLCLQHFRSPRAITNLEFY